ncbi:putative homing endonuclease [Cronobacter phage vB_CsaD_Banach]|nr:putative homing endonuclease [Cronobacter phage vB_CsaD_Banach]
MNYKRIYKEIIENRRNNPVSGMVEVHHIIPKSMGGDDSEGNLIALSPREHFVAHYILAKIHNNKSMWCAYWFMCNTRDVKITSRQYDTARKLSSEHLKGNTHTLGHTLSQSHRKKIGDGVRGERNGNYGKTFSEEHKRKIAESRRGKPHDEESRKRMIEAAKHKEKVTCIHCNRVLDKGNYKLWHGDKCKMKVG